MVDRINAKTRLACLIASPAEHSGSPTIYNAAFVKLGLNYSYMAFDVPEKLAEAIDAIRLFNMLGANISMPHKAAAVKYMDELSPAAELIGAVNMVLNKDGRLIGHNTDGVGFVSNLRDHGVEVKGKKTVLVGIGGAGSAVAAQCALEGVTDLVLFNKMDAFWGAAQELTERIKSKTSCTVRLEDVDDKQAMADAVKNCDLFINATSLGMGKLEHLSVLEDASLLRPEVIVADTVYHPPVTKLLSMAQAVGCKTINGKGMLLGQAAENFKLYTGQEMPLEYVRDVLENA